ncbi:MAG TPA: DNA-binding protein [Anaeromyxobacteraceae bacterium]|nr:DNA-binding protein [Anaeromyxobacteraceae bacterium]
MAACLAALGAWHLGRRGAAPDDPLAGARFLKLTEFDGIEQAAALSRDGRFVAFQSNRDGRMDVWVTQIGTGQFLNLTRGSAPEIANPSIRTLGFSPDGTLVTFWVRRADAPGGRDISIWAAPLLGGPPRPYLEGVAEFDWSADGARLVYHTPGPGDPTFVRDSTGSAHREIFSAAAGLHAHFHVWSPDQAFVYFVQGSLPDRLDVWRIRPAGGIPERITHHDSLVSHPLFVDGRTLLYLAADADGFGPWIHSLDVEERTPRRLSAGIDRCTSLAVSGDGRRIVATMASPKATLWRVPIAEARADLSAARRIALTTGNRSSPRFGPGYLLYVSSKGASDGLWKLQEGAAAELWSAADTRIAGAPAIARDGRRIAFTTRQGGRTALWVVNQDGTGARAVTTALELVGAPAWAPDGKSITVAAAVSGLPRLFGVPLEGGSPTPLVTEHSVDPAWSPEGNLVAFSGADVGTTFVVKAVRADGGPYRLPPLTLTRGARHLVFMPQGRSLVVLQGEIRHKNLWLVNLKTGDERPLTDLPPDFEVRDFDVSPDGREIVLEQVQEQSDLVLIERPPPR